MKAPSELFDLLDRDGQRHAFSKVLSFGSQCVVALIVGWVLMRGGHFQMWDCAALAIVVLTPNAYGVAKTAMRLKWEKPAP